MNFDLVDIFKSGLALLVEILILYANSSVVIKLTLE